MKERSKTMNEMPYENAETYSDATPIPSGPIKFVLVPYNPNNYGIRGRTGWLCHICGDYHSAIALLAEDPTGRLNDIDELFAADHLRVCAACLKYGDIDGILERRAAILERSAERTRALIGRLEVPGFEAWQEATDREASHEFWSGLDAALASAAGSTPAAMTQYLHHWSYLWPKIESEIECDLDKHAKLLRAFAIRSERARGTPNPLIDPDPIPF
jgi:hypothetical protein